MTAHDNLSNGEIFGVNPLDISRDPLKVMTSFAFNGEWEEGFLAKENDQWQIL